MLPSIDGFIALSVILESPGARPEVSVIRGQHSTFAPSGQNLVLAKRKHIYIAHRSNRMPFVNGSKRLRAIFNHFQSIFARTLEDRVHIAWPAREMHRDDGACTRAENSPDRLRGDVL